MTEKIVRRDSEFLPFAGCSVNFIGPVSITEGKNSHAEGDIVCKTAKCPLKGETRVTADLDFGEGHAVPSFAEVEVLKEAIRIIESECPIRNPKS